MLSKAKTKSEIIWERTQKILELWQLGNTQESIAQMLNIKRSMVMDTLRGKYNSK